MQLRVIAVNEVLDQILDMLRRVIGEHISLQVSCSPSLPGIRADAGMVEQVVINLAVNARDAMPEGGVLRLVTSLFIADEAFVRQQPEARLGRHVCLTISDTGCGIARSRAMASLGQLYHRSSRVTSLLIPTTRQYEGVPQR